MSRALGFLGAVALLFGLGTYQVLQAASAFVVINLVVGVLAWAGAVLLLMTQVGRSAQPALRAPMTRAIGSAAAVCALATGLYWLAVRADVRLDWTMEGRYELSEATLALVGDLEQPLELTLYYEAGDPRIRSTRLLLEEIARFGDVRVQTRVLSEHPDDEDAYGIGSSDSVVVRSGRDWSLVERPTEGALYQAMASLVNPRRSLLYVSVGAGEGDLERMDDIGYSGLRAALESEGFELRPLPLAIVDQVPGDADAVLVIGARRPLPPAALVALEHFVDRGGALVAFLEPGVETGLEALLARYGLASEDSWVIDPHSGAVEGEPLGRSPVISSYAEHPVTHGLGHNRMTFLRGSRAFQLHKAQPEDRVRGVALSSRDAWLDPDGGALRPNDVAVPPPGARFDYHPMVATAEIERGGGRARLLAFGDSDLASNRYLRALYNLDLVLNGIHWVTERESAIALRPKIGGRQLIQFPVPLQTSLQALYGAGLLIPELLLLAAAGVYLRQRSG